MLYIKVQICLKKLRLQGIDLFVKQYAIYTDISIPCKGNILRWWSADSVQARV